MAWKFCNPWGANHVEAFGDSLLVVQQISKVCHCYNSSLNAYLDKCLDIIFSFDEFVIRYLSREENGQANALAQQASGYKVERKIFNFGKPIQMKAELQVLDGLTGLWTSLPAQTDEGADSAVKGDLVTKVEDQDWRIPIIS